MMLSSGKGENLILRLHLIRNVCTRLEEKVIVAIMTVIFSILFGFSGILFKSLHLLTVNTDIRVFFNK